MKDILEPVTCHCKMHCYTRVYSFCARVRLPHIFAHLSHVGRIRSRLPERFKSALLWPLALQRWEVFSYSAGDIPDTIPFIQERCQNLWQLRSPTQLWTVESVEHSQRKRLEVASCKPSLGFKLSTGQRIVQTCPPLW